MAAPIPNEALAHGVRAAFGSAARIVVATPLAGDASNRRYVRLALSGGTAPPTVVAMLLDGARQISDELGGPDANAEVPFVNVGRYLAAHELPVPGVYLARSSEGFLLLEDVGDTTLWRAVEAAPARAAPLFAAAVDLLVDLQVIGTRHPDTTCVAFSQRFDGRLARLELEHFVEHGIETRHGRKLPGRERDELLAALAPVVAPFESAALVLAHRDYMAWNLHVQGERLRVIDFQDALLAPDAFDLAQLLTDRTTGTIVSPALEETLIARFVAGRAAAGLPLTEGFDDRYRLCGLQHALKVIGRFYFLEVVKKKPGYLAYLPAVYAVAHRLLASLPALAPARALMAPHVPELAAETL